MEVAGAVPPKIKAHASGVADDLLVVHVAVHRRKVGLDGEGGAEAFVDGDSIEAQGVFTQRGGDGDLAVLLDELAHTVKGEDGWSSEGREAQTQPDNSTMTPST